MKKKITSLIIFLLLALSAYSEPYSYEDLIAIMSVNNIELLLQDEVIKSATLDLKDAKANYSPQIDLSLMGTYMFNPPEITFDNISMDDSNSLAPYIQEAMKGASYEVDPALVMATLSVTQPIFTWGKINNAVKLYDKILEIRQVEKSDKIDSLSVELEGYLGALYYAKEILMLLEKADEELSLLVDIAKSGYENGALLISDYNEARLSKSQAALSITEASLQTDALRESIRKILGTDITDDDYAFTPDEDYYYSIASMDREELRIRSTSSANKNIRMASLSVDAAEYGRKIASASFYGKPDLALRVSLGYGGFIQDDWTFDTDYSLNVTLSLSTTLWDGGKILNDISRAKSQAETSALNLESATRDLGMALEESFRNMDLSISRIHYYESKKSVLEDEKASLDAQLEKGYTGESEVLKKNIEIYENEIALIMEKASLMQAALSTVYIAGLR